MRFAYAYRSSDNKRHEDVFEAKSREDVYLALRAKGIRPTKVWPLDKPRNLKPLCAALALGLALGAGFAVFRVRQSASVVPAEARKQLYGDATTIEQGMRGDWANVLDDPGERLLAAYAQPGRRVEPRPAAQRPADAAALTAALGRRLEYAEIDTPEHRQLKRIVEGMKNEVRGVLRAGGTVEGYLAALDERQRKECEIYEAAAAEFEKDKVGKTGDVLYRAWMRANAKLKSMGIRLLPAPAELEE